MLRFLSVFASSWLVREQIPLRRDDANLGSQIEHSDSTFSILSLRIFRNLAPGAPSIT
jgi:hypothetical protein